MKNVLALLTIAATMSFASPNPDSITVTAAFTDGLKKEFPDAINIRWQKAGDYYMATFSHRNEQISAYFDEQAEIRKVTRYISPEALPMNILKALQDKYEIPAEDFTVMEMMMDGNTSYYVSFTKNNRKYIVESDTVGNLRVIRNQKL